MKNRKKVISIFFCIFVFAVIILIGTGVYRHTQNHNPVDIETEDTESFKEETHNYYYYYDGSEEALPLESPDSQDYYPTEE